MEEANVAGDGKQDAEVNNKNLIINYLPQALTDKEFSQMFSSVGAIKKCRVMRNMQTGYSFGYGFVEYVNPGDADKAIASLDGLAVQNKKIKVSYARPPGQDIKDTNLYIQNLPRNIDETFLDQLFSPFGKIVQRRLLLDKYTQMPRGVGFVRFSRRDEAQRAIRELNGVVPSGGTQALNVKVAEDYSKSKQMNMLQHVAFGAYGPRGGGQGQPYARGGRGRGGPAPPAGLMGSRPPRPFYGGAAAFPPTAPPPAADFTGYGGGYGDYGAADGGYGGYAGGYVADGGGYAANSGGYGADGGYGGDGGGYGADGTAAETSSWSGAAPPPARGAARGLPRRGGRGFNKAMPFKSNNRFNPMGSGF